MVEYPCEHCGAPTHKCQREERDRLRAALGRATAAIAVVQDGGEDGAADCTLEAILADPDGVKALARLRALEAEHEAVAEVLAFGLARPESVDRLDAALAAVKAANGGGRSR